MNNPKKLLCVVFLSISASQVNSATLVGWVTDPSTAAVFSNEVRDIQIQRTGSYFFSFGEMPMYSEPYVGKIFIPASDSQVYDVPLRAGEKTIDWYEDTYLILGGIDARQEIDSSSFLIPEPHTALMTSMLLGLGFAHRRR